MTDRTYSDIKPENILFQTIPSIPRKHRIDGSDDGNKKDEGEFLSGLGSGGIGIVKLADFGLSKVIWDNQTVTPCGTVGYSAPEIVKDEFYSKSVDMWAIGCVLYTLLCGFPPFYDENVQFLTEKIARGQYTFLSPWWDDISKSAQDLISHLLTVDPQKRYTIEDFLAHPWVCQTDEDTIAAADAPPLATPYAPLRQTCLQQSELIGADQSLYRPSKDELKDMPSTSSERQMHFASPSAYNLREVIDVGYALIRQGEEAKRRRKIIRQPDDLSAVEAKLRSINLGAQSSTAQAKQAYHELEPQGYGQHSPVIVAAAMIGIRSKQQQPFELSLDGATLLEKRKHHT
jgi:serine/threonine protein kinase